MASIGIDLGGEISASRVIDGNPCMLIEMHKKLGEGGKAFTYSRLTLYLNGSPDDMRSFAEKILAALPVAPRMTDDEVRDVVNHLADITRANAIDGEQPE